MTRSDKRNLKKSKKRRDRIEAERRNRSAGSGITSALHAEAAVFGHLILGSFDYDAADVRDAIQAGAGATEIIVRRLIDRRLSMGELSEGTNDGCGAIANWMAAHCAQMLTVIGRIFGRAAMDEFSDSVCGMFKMEMANYDAKDETVNRIKAGSSDSAVTVSNGVISITNVEADSSEGGE